ncbi:MAG: hypothetical protein RI936_38 [Pseudomonadota bacterium]|jgi:hypothetical protein
MQITTTVRSPRAMALAGIFVAGTAFVLFQDVWHGAPFSTAHVLTGLALIATTAAGHCIWPAFAARQRAVGLGCVVLFLAGLTYIVAMSGARNAEVTAIKVAAADDAAKKRGDAQRRRDDARNASTAADAHAATSLAAVGTACKDGDGKLCKGARATNAAAQEYARLARADLRDAQRDLDAIKAPAAPTAGYAHVARILTLAGGNATLVEDAIVLAMPFLAVLITELATVVFLAMALGHRVVDAEALAPPVRKPLPDSLATLADPATALDADVLAVRSCFRPGERSLTNNEIAQRMGVKKGEASKRVSAAVAGGHAQRVPRGRTVAISLV